MFVGSVILLHELLSWKVCHGSTDDYFFQPNCKNLTSYRQPNCCQLAIEDALHRKNSEALMETLLLPKKSRCQLSFFLIGRLVISIINSYFWSPFLCKWHPTKGRIFMRCTENHADQDNICQLSRNKLARHKRVRITPVSVCSVALFPIRQKKEVYTTYQIAASKVLDRLLLM